MTTPLTLPTSFLSSDNVSPYLAANLPVNRPSAGAAGESRVVQAGGIVAVTSNLATTAGVRLVRIPTNAFVRSVKIGIEKATLTFTSLTGCLGLAFSTNAPFDGTPFALLGQVYSCAAFAGTTTAGFDFSSVALDVMLDVTYKSQLGISSMTDGYYTMSASHLPIWQAIANGGTGGLGKATTGNANGLTVDPGGFFDIYYQPTTTTNVTANFYMLCECTYISY